MLQPLNEHPKWIKIVLAIIIISFIFWGIGSYLSFVNDDTYVAKVGNDKIYLNDVDQAMSDASNKNMDKTSVLMGLVNRQLLINMINDNHLRASNEEIRQMIAEQKDFQDKEGNFDPNKYLNYLKQASIPEQKVEQQMSDQVIIKNILDIFHNDYISSNEFSKKLVYNLSKERQVAQYKLSALNFYNTIVPSESEIMVYYLLHQDTFTTPDGVKLQYLLLDGNDLLKTINISESAINQYMKTHHEVASNQFLLAHILFSSTPNASLQDKENIKNKAQAVLQQALAHSDQFTALAQRYSQDAGSKDNGGSLGWLNKQSMLPQFADAITHLHNGDIYPHLIKTQYGYHIVKLISIQQNQTSRKTIADQLAMQQENLLLQSMVDKLNTITYNNPKNLDKAAQQLHLSIQQTPNFINKNVNDNSLFANAKVQQAIFSKDVVVNRNNSEVINLGNNLYGVFRVTDYRAAKLESLAAVKNAIINDIKHDKALNIVANQGEQLLAKLRNNTANQIVFSDPIGANLLSDNPQINGKLMSQIFAINAKKLPAYIGAINNNGDFVIYKIISEKVNEAFKQQADFAVKQVISGDANVFLLSSYINNLHSIYNVVYRMNLLNNNSSNNNVGQ
jgi:peptidyl-prolyl cis-trans isomerase D